MLFLAFSSVAHGQIRPMMACDPEVNQPGTISSVTPSTWYAGQQVQITITGNFPGGDQPGCEMNEDAITNAAGDTDTLATIETDPGGCGCYATGTFSPTQVTITVKVAANHPPGLVHLELSCDGCGTTAISGPIQIVARGPTITSISPDAWFAGQSTDITITGAGFLTATDPGGPTELRIMETSGNIAISNVAVVSATEITATAAPGKNSPAGLATVKVTNHPPGESPRSGTATEPILPIPEIFWHSKKISGENAKTQSIKVGQPVELTATPTSLPTGLTLGPVSWAIDGTTVGSYDGSAAGIDITDAVLSTPNTTFYWLYPDTGLNVVYNYCAQDVSGNQYCSPRATATYNAKRPNISLSTWDYGRAQSNILTFAMVKEM